MDRPSLRLRRLPAFAASCALAAAGAAQAQDPPKAETPAGASPPKDFVGPGLIRREDGLLVKYYRTKFRSPEALRADLAPWISGATAVEVSGPGFAQVNDPPPLSQGGGTGAVPKTRPHPPNVPPVNNTLRITVAEDQWPNLERLLAMLDAPQLQVRVAAKVLELTFEDHFRVGVTSRLNKPVGDAFFRSIDAKFPNPIDATNGATAAFRSVEKYLVFDYALEAVEQGAKAEVVSKPSILVGQGDTAVIRSGDDEPFVQQTISGGSLTTSTTFKPVGVTLEVQPIHIGDGAVRVRIAAEASRLSDFRVTGISETQQVVNAVISTRRADTVITVLDGSTAIVGGLEQTSKRDQRTGVPFVSKIPLLGWFFGSTTKRDVKTELFFWIKLDIETPEESRILEPEK